MNAAHRRLAQGILANVAALVTRVLVQFATLPILFAAWPAERVGAWLALFAIPSYVTLVGTGFAGAGGSAALAAAQAGDDTRARADFQAAWGIASAGTCVLALLFVIGGEGLVALLGGGIAAIAAEELSPALLWLGAYILVTSQMAVLEIAFRVAGRYPGYIWLNCIAALVDVAVIAFALQMGADLAMLAMALTLARLATVVLGFALALRAAPALFARPSTPLRASARALWRPSLAFMVMPLVAGLNLQGYLLLVGASFGAAALAAFAATRTLTRLLDLVVNLAYAVQYYEAGYGAAQERRQLATMTALMLAASIAIAAVLLLAGPWLQPLYTAGATAFDPVVAGVLLAAAALRALAATPMALIAADNRHAGLIAGYLAGSVLGLVLAAMLAAAGAPLPVMLLPLVLAEASQALPAFRVALARSTLTARGFARMLLARERIGDLAALLRLIRRPS